MWPTEKTSRPTDSALLSVYKLNIWMSAIGPALLNGPVWDVCPGPKGHVLTEEAWGKWPSRPSPWLENQPFQKVRMLAREIPYGWFVAAVKPDMTINAWCGIYSRQKMPVRWENKIPSPLVRDPEDRLWLPWLSPHNVLSKQICKPAHESGPVRFLFGLMAQPD